MHAVATGESTALRELCGRYERPLYGFLHRAADGREVDDLYQETWLRVVRSARSFDPARRFSTWLFQIALNLCRDLRRRSIPVPTADHDLDAAQLRDSSAHGGEARDATLDVARLLAALRLGQREVVLLRVLHDASEEEAAEILGCPRGTVKSRLHHGLARLAALVRPEVAS